MLIKLVDGTNDDFKLLTALLDQDYIDRFGDLALDYQSYNVVEDSRTAFVVYDQKTPVACGSIKIRPDGAGEIKRMFVLESYRRQKIGSSIIYRCEQEALKRGCKTMVLETGAAMAEALALYEKHGYHKIKNFAPFENDEVCVCMKKELKNSGGF